MSSLVAKGKLLVNGQDISDILESLTGSLENLGQQIDFMVATKLSGGFTILTSF